MQEREKQSPVAEPLERQGMRIIKLKCESNQLAYDQTVRQVVVEREDENNWYGKPIANPACPTLQWPKFAWKEIEPRESVRKTVTRSPDPHTKVSPSRGEEFDA